jgi:Domain of unknown function (DUF4124)
MRSQAAVFMVSFALLTPAVAQQPPPTPLHLYKCTDASGKVYYTQLPPRECLGRDTQELNKSGVVVKESQRAATPSEIQARDADKKKKAEQAEKDKEERRKNTALLNTYSSEKDIEDARQRSLQEAKTAIEDTQKHITALQKRQKDLEGEKEFYVKKPLPAKIKQEMSNNDIEIKNQTALLEVKKTEIDHINAKYDEDKRRYVDLTTAKK